MNENVAFDVLSPSVRRGEAGLLLKTGKQAPNSSCGLSVTVKRTHPPERQREGGATGGRFVALLALLGGTSGQTMVSAGRETSSPSRVSFTAILAAIVGTSGLEKPEEAA